jgi:hypothetical protein
MILSPETAVYPASERCRTFQHSVRTATKRAVSFIEGFYGLASGVKPLPVNGKCGDYTASVKKSLNVDLVSCLAGNSIQGVDELYALSFAASISSIPKSWPQCCDCMEGGLEEELIGRLTQKKSDLLPEGYLEFVGEVVHEIFPKGIRKSEIERHARRVTPPFSSTTEATRSEGGSYSSWMGRRGDYLNSLEKPEVLHRPSFMVANAPGKPRPLVKNHPSYLLLKPVHTAIYDRLSKHKWLLRGDLRHKSLISAGFTPGGDYLSADFTAATDNLRIEISEAIIDSIARFSSPSAIPLLSEARRSLRPLIAFTNTTIEPVVGQLMGNLVSFPLLCLQNYIAARWVDKLAGVGEVPKLINGDDLIVQAPLKWVEIYKREASRIGFHLNEKKTSYSSRFLVGNSTYFSSRFRMIPFVRAAGLTIRDPRDVGTVMNDILRPFVSVRSNKTRQLVHLLSIHFRRLIRASGLNLYSLGFRVSRLGDLRLTREIEQYEVYRSGHDARKIFRVEPPMRLDLVKSEDPFGVHDDSELAEAVVAEHWEGGEFVKAEKEKLREVLKRLKSERMTRYQRMGRRRTLRRLLRVETVKTVWIPRRVADCYDLTHETIMLDDDGFFVKKECKICDRVREIINERRQLEKEKDDLEFAQWELEVAWTRKWLIHYEGDRVMWSLD